VCKCQNTHYTEEQMNIKKILSALLALLTVASLAACASDADTGAADTTAADNVETTTAEVERELTNAEKFAAARAAMPKIDYEGHEYKIVDREDATINWTTVDVWAEGETGDPINDAVYERNMALEENFNIKIKERKITPHSTVSTTLATEIMSGDYTFDVVTDGLSQLSKTLATPGYLVDLNEVAEIDLSQPYWDQLITKFMTIKDKTFFATGDISIMDNLGTWAVLFNKSMVNDYNLEDPYTNVHDGTWTLDLFYDMCKAAAVDINGDGEMDENDQFGFLSESYNTFALWNSTGERLTTMNDDGVPELSMYNERSVAVVEKVQKIMLDQSCTITGNEYPNAMLGINAAYAEGKGLFIYGGLMLVTNFRSSEVDFGIVPAPKYDENQDQYYSCYSNGNTTAYALAITNPDLSRAATILEQMAILSQYTLTPAYYDITLEGKFLRDEESSAMIDIILDTRNYDLGAIYNWGDIQGMFASKLYAGRSSDFASAYAAIEESAITAMNSYIETLED